MEVRESCAVLKLFDRAAGGARLKLSELILCSVSMALPAHILDRLPPALLRGSTVVAERGQRSRGLPLGNDALDAALPDSGLLRGGIVELAVAGTASVATSVALLACRAAQRENHERGGDTP